MQHPMHCPYAEFRVQTSKQLPSIPLKNPESVSSLMQSATPDETTG